MAIIGSIQKHSKIVIVIIGFALLAFVVGSFTGKNKSNSSYVGEINGDKIRGADFNAKVEEASEMRKQMSGRTNVPAAESFSIRESVWNQMVSELIMQKQYDKLGIEVSKDEMDDMITGKTHISISFRILQILKQVNLTLNRLNNLLIIWIK